MTNRETEGTSHDAGRQTAGRATAWQALLWSTLVAGALALIWAAAGLWKQPRLALFGAASAVFAGFACMSYLWPTRCDARTDEGLSCIRANLIRRTLGVAAVPSYLLLLAFTARNHPRAERMVPLLIVCSLLTLMSLVRSAWTVTIWTKDGIERRLIASRAWFAWAEVDRVERFGDMIAVIHLARGTRWRVPVRWDGFPRFAAELVRRAEDGSISAKLDVLAALKRWSGR
jgi:hypothetical protein